MKFAYLIEPPFNDHSPSGEVIGCDVEIARHVAARLGTSFEPIETEFAQLLPGVAAGQWRMTTGLFATEERQETAAFSRPIWALPDGLLLQEGNPKALSGYRSVAQDGTAVLAVIRDQFQHRFAISFGVPEERILIFETYNEAAEAVQNGKADAYASVGRAHAGFLNRQTESSMTWLAVPIAEKPPAFGCFAFSKADLEFRDRVNAILELHIGSDAHRETMARYGFSEEEVDILLR